MTAGPGHEETEVVRRALQLPPQRKRRNLEKESRKGGRGDDGGVEVQNQLIELLIGRWGG